MNIIGGNDLSMHEINTAAEAITSAADPDANIIFGATINPELDGEVIITVVATGFDASYFSRGGGAAAATTATAPEPTASAHTKADDEMSKIDMSLDEHVETMTDFKADNAPNIWTLEEHEEEEKTEDSKEDEAEHKDTEKDADSELEKPSFLRRLAKRYKDHGADNDEDKKS
jgi:cell division GTPase FtsZ